MPVAMSAADLDPFGCLPVKGAIPDQELDHADGRRGEGQRPAGGVLALDEGHDAWIVILERSLVTQVAECRKAKQICAVGKSYIRINEIA